MQKTIDGVRLSYDDDGSGPDALVLVHGFLLNRSAWDAQAAALAERVRVVRVDLRGSGDSGHGEGPALMETMAGDLFGLLESLDVRRAVIAGHSLGGYVALAFFRMYAERVAGLGLVASTVAPDRPEQRAARDELVARIVREGIGAAAASYLPRLFAPAVAGERPELVERARSMMLASDADGACAQLIGMKERVGSDDLLEDLTLPTTIVAGVDDAFIPVDAARATAAALADCELVELHGVGHMPLWEAADATTAALARLAERSLSASGVR